MSTTSAAVRRNSDDEVGLWVFLATEVLFFGVLLFGYVVTRIHHPQAFALASRHTDIVLGSVNTAVLLTSSLTVALSSVSLELGRRRAAQWLLAATLVLGATFLALKLLEYAHDIHEHLVPWLDFSLRGPDVEGEKLFFFMYFVMTGAHAVHLIVGLSLVATMIVVVGRRKTATDSSGPVELTALYWHLVDVIWIFLYPMLYLISRT
jgi:cytochrome c oxidase subunit III